MIRRLTARARRASIPVVRAIQRRRLRQLDDTVFSRLLLAALHEKFFFVQVGANDGVRFDPLRKYILRYDLAGLAMEPVPRYFAELERNLRGTRVQAVNKALYREDGTVTMYRVRDDAEVPRWARGIASLDPGHHRKSDLPSDLIMAEEVEAISLPTLVERYGITAVDLLVIDAEGYDAEIIRMIDWSLVKPGIIVFEHGLRDAVIGVDDFSEVVGILAENGYRLYTGQYDCIAWRA